MTLMTLLKRLKKTLLGYISIGRDAMARIRGRSELVGGF